MQARDSEWANRTKAQNMEIAYFNSGLIKEVASSHVVLILEVEGVEKT